ncbi:MAG: pantetheine-phosphate adenylyltransferase [Gemmatimonadaceae bacterium]
MTPTNRVALYPGSFDPLTHGHEDLIRRALVFADRVVVAVAININKMPLFSTEERVAFIREALRDEPRVEVQTFTGLLVDFARDIGATINVRGVRGVNDFENESQMAHMNRNLYPALETVFLTPSVETAYVSSSLVREVARFGGDVSALVHPTVARALVARFKTKG